MSHDRYARQARFPALGESGQARLGQAQAVVVGCGALGTVSAELLARAGCGRLHVIDRDYVELSNLQRQLLFDERDAEEALPKAIAAERRLRQINGEIEVHGVVDDLTSKNAEELLAGADVIVDGTDNFDARYLINDYSVKNGVSWIYGAAVGSYGIVIPMMPQRSACFRCVYPEPPAGAQPTCETAGVLGPVTALVGSLQAAAALQILSGHGDEVRLKITTVDVWHGPVRELSQPGRSTDCPACGHRNFEWLDGGHDTPVSLCGRNAVQIHALGKKLDLGELRARLDGMGQIRSNEFALRFYREPYEMTVFADGRVIVKGTTDVGIARAWYARWVG